VKKLYRFVMKLLYGLGFALFIFYAFLFLYPIPAQLIIANTWIDEDGDTAISIDDLGLSIYSMSNFYYFDEIFSAALDGQKIRLCIGPAEGEGIAENCYENLVVFTASYSKGKNQSIDFSIKNHQQEFQEFKQSLRDGKKMKVTIDNYTVYASYALHTDHKLDTQYEEMLTWVN